MLKRHEIQVLGRAEHTWSKIATLSGVSEKAARRIAAENPITRVDNGCRARPSAGWPPVEGGSLLRRARRGADGGGLVADERVETLVRALVEHLAAFGDIPLVTVFDRPKTIALKWGRDGVVTEWNPTFAGVALDLGIGVAAV